MKEEDIQKHRFVPLLTRAKPGSEPKVDCQFDGMDGTRISSCKKCGRFVRIELGGIRCRSAVDEEEGNDYARE